ncbi:MAG TPA: ATP-dependent DNA helicase RecQ [Terracidiphilus sp.]|nr:ATP-dependent DNA helicase RecQ [Terracidiphilus sp.]
MLRSVFGFARFRANQLEVCEAAVAGRDLLLVMPTGAGKSLCYQLPALARGGTALVISPLIALMEDQAAKLAGLGLRVARIHSGLERTVARQACVDYLNGTLQFLFIAPERLRVPGFAEMLAKRRLALIAIDEAHCISQWGHDFRPDYRMLGQYLPSLRGEGAAAPVLAMTATATPDVQADITAQLGMAEPALFIHGFRRDNLAIEVVELPVPERAGVIASLLAAPERRPAIVYATSRKQAERLAEELSLKPSRVRGSGRTTGRIAAAAYHAGLDAGTRERVQTAFQAGELEVVVATIAFGMGIDKADIRTVIHAGLPATLEGYYQEIGRAGRDGAMSRTFLMHSYADQKTHDFFLNRDYPPTEHLAQVFRALGEEPRAVEELRATSQLGEEEFDKALEKLEIHGGARRDFGGSPQRVTVGVAGWKRTYSVQAQYRAEQFAKVLRYTELSECRMSALVRHFGDVEDAKQACGVCDVCDPAGAVLRQFRRATTAEQDLAQRIVEELRGVDYKAGAPTERSWSVGWKAAGTLQRNLDLVGRISRDEYEGLLGAMVQSGLIEIEEAEFEKEGEVIRFRKVRLTDAGLAMRRGTPLDHLLISDGIVEEFGGRGEAPARAKKAKAPAKAEPRKSGVGTAAAEPVRLSAECEALAGRIREWRAAEAKRLRVPAYMVLHDRTVAALARVRPRNPRELLGIDGIGEAKVERFGEEILRLCAAG